MVPPVVLRISVEVDGGWHVHLGTPGPRPGSGRIPPEEVLRIAESVPGLLRPPAAYVSSAVAARQRAEEEAGHLLARVFSPPHVASKLAEYLGAASTQSEVFVLVVDSPEPSVLGLPWELVAARADLPGLEEARNAVVVRLAEGPARPRRAPSPRLRCLCWCPTPDDPVCAGTVGSLRRAAEAAGLGWQDLPTILVDGLPRPPAEVRDVLVVVCHGAREDGRTLIDLGTDEGGPGSLSGLLSNDLHRLEGVLLGVCEGAAPSHAQLSDVAGRLLHAGASVVVATDRPVSDVAWTTFATEFLAAVGRADTLALAVRTARRAVGALWSPHSDSRPSAFLAQVTDVDLLHRPWTMNSRSLPGWPPTDLPLGALLSEAQARARALGWIGLEHIMLSWREDGRLARDFVRRLPGWSSEFARYLASGLDERRHGPELWISPRLTRLAAALPGERARLDHLVAALIDDPAHGLHALGPASLREILRNDGDSMSASVHEVDAVGLPAEAFEVVWGPEDGRRLTLDPGQVIGRASTRGGADVALYLDGPVVDRLLQRRHLRFLGPGRVEPLAAVRRVAVGERWPEARPLGTEDHVVTGDLLLLSPSTWLRAVPPPRP